MLPWGTPDLTADQPDDLPLRTTRCFLSLRNLSIQLSRGPSNPCALLTKIVDQFCQSIGIYTGRSEAGAASSMLRLRNTGRSNDK